MLQFHRSSSTVRLCPIFGEGDYFQKQMCWCEIIGIIWIFWRCLLFQLVPAALCNHLRSRNVELELGKWLSGQQNCVSSHLPFNFAFTSLYYLLFSRLIRKNFLACAMWYFCNCSIWLFLQVSADELHSLKDPLPISIIFCVGIVIIFGVQY